MHLLIYVGSAHCQKLDTKIIPVVVNPSVDTVDLSLLLCSTGSDVATYMHIQHFYTLTFNYVRIKHQTLCFVHKCMYVPMCVWLLCMRLLIVY